ncbi:MAG: hypothetical protein KY475_25480 [Planctomycetes bacterium]|nr:hypothetical protein [Planctomycetota bacterium]
MTRSFRCTLSTFAAVVLTWGFAFAPSLGAQEAKQPAQPAADADSSETEEEREYRRLPLYYAQVVAPYQRENIYGIQAKYEDQIKELQAQIRAILAKREAEIEQVLFPEQREVLKKLRAEAEAQRAAAAAKRRPADETPATSAPAAPKKTATSDN